MTEDYRIHNLKILIIYSVIAYLLAYMFVFLSYNLITAIVGKYYHIKTVLNHNYLLFLTQDNSSLWTFTNSFIIFTSSAVLLIILALILIKIFKYYEKKTFLIKIFLFWIVLHIINRILGFFIIGTIFDLYYLNVLFDWLLIEYWVRLVIIFIVTFSAILFIGVKTTRPLLLTSRSFEYVRSKNKLLFVEAQAFIAWFLASVLIFILHLPSFSYIENLLSVSMFFLILPSYFTHKHIKNLPSDNGKITPKYKIPWLFIGILISLLLVFRFLLSKGIPF